MDDPSGKPSENAIDLVQSMKAKDAYAIFRLNILRIRELLLAASQGIEKSKDSVASLLAKFASAESDPEEDEGDGPKVQKLDNGLIQVRFTKREVALVREAIGLNASIVGDLHFHLHNILLVSSWTAFEGYVQGRLAELFLRRFDLLSSDKKMSIAEIVAARTNLHEHLIAKEIEDVGRKSFDDLQIYLKRTILFQFSKANAGNLRRTYFVRNVVAHSAGFLRANQLHLVPSGIEVFESELRISQKYLEAVIRNIQDSVAQMSAHLRSMEPLVTDLEEKGSSTKSPVALGSSKKQGTTTRRGRPRKTDRPGH